VQNLLATNASSFEACLKQEDFTALAELVHDVCGMHLPKTKSTMLQARLRRRLQALDLQGFDQYLDLLRDPVERAVELPRLIEAITTNKTEFFRESVHFDFLVEHGLEMLAEIGAGQSRPLRAWSSACSTGQEAYTLAMVLANVPRQQLPRGFQIVASDISEAVLQTARRAIYPEALLGEVPEPYRSKYLLRTRDRSLGVVRIAPELRKLVNIKNINLNDKIKDLNGEMDVIFCRNILIYFDQNKKIDIIKRITECLRVGGILFLGHADSTSNMNLPIQQLLPSVYRRI
jgi:chemotaxis protein methyltransferase CheR